MDLTFNLLATVTSGLLFVLATSWAFAPRFVIAYWGVTYTPAVGVGMHRVAALFLGVGTMLFLARNAEPSSARHALSIGVFVGATALAAQLLWELARGSVKGAWVWAAIVIEAVIAIGFAIHVYQSRA
jgi:hypothetical protein